MSYEAVDKVIRSDIEDATLFSVLLALAFFKNDRTGECFPSTDRIATTARRSPNVVRSAIKRLEQLGYLETKQVPGLRRFFVIHLERLPSKAEPLADSEPLADCHPLSEVQPLSEAQPLSEVTGDPFQKCEGTPFRSVRGPLSEVTPEQGIEQGKEQVIEQGSLSSSDLVLSPDTEQPTAKPKTKRSKATVDRPDDVSEQVWDEFLILRKQKRKTFTELALKGMRREAEAAGLSLEEAMTMSIEHGWQSFQARYVQDQSNGNRYRSKRQPTCPGDWENEYKGVDYTRGAVMKEFTPEESAELNRICEEMGF